MKRVNKLIIKFLERGFTKRLARKKAMVCLAWDKASKRGDSTKAKYWAHINTKIDLEHAPDWTMHQISDWHSIYPADHYMYDWIHHLPCATALIDYSNE